MLDRYESLVAAIGEEPVSGAFDAGRTRAARRVLRARRAVRAERPRPRRRRSPISSQLVRAWGGVTSSIANGCTIRLPIVSTTKRSSSRSKRASRSLENLNPVEAIADEQRRASAMNFERKVPDGRDWQATAT